MNAKLVLFCLSVYKCQKFTLATQYTQSKLATQYTQSKL